MKKEIFSHIPTSDELLCRIREDIPSYLSADRLSHTLSVEKQACELSDIFFPYLGVDEKYKNDISAAALLHDMTKSLSSGEQDSLCRQYDIVCDYVQKSSGALLHSETAAYKAKALYGINDIVFSAVFHHTTGCEDMNIFDKIIFLSDFIEPTRKHEVCRKARLGFYDSLNECDNKLYALDKAIIGSIDSTLLHLIQSGNTADVETVKARNYLIAEYAKL